jgi:hypothetical protein
MQHYENKTETVTHMVFVKMTCDICGRESKSSHGWSDEKFTVDETEIRHRTGRNFPEGGSGEEIQVEICPDCFTGKLIPWLESQGVKIQKKEWDY